MDLESPEKSWRKGLRGEQKVASKLSALQNEWHVLHSVPVGRKGADIDHLVIGLSGIYALNTKNHSSNNVWVNEDEFVVDGKVRDYARSSHIEGARASRILSNACGFRVRVQAVIVVIARRLTLVGQPNNVAVLDRNQLCPWLELQHPSLNEERVEAIYAVARQRTTWA